MSKTQRRSGQVPGSDWTNMALEQDLKVSARRFNEYIRLSREGLTFDEILPMLPTDGAFVMRCGHTRFDHADRGCDATYRGGFTTQRGEKGSRQPKRRDSRVALRT